MKTQKIMDVVNIIFLVVFFTLFGFACWHGFGVFIGNPDDDLYIRFYVNGLKTLFK